MGTKTTTKENDSTSESPEAPPPPMDAFPPPVEEEAEKGSSCGTADSATQEENEKDGELALQEQQESEKYECGDHVYQWCSLLGIPGVFQHHGIVIGVQETVGEGGEDEQLLTIADFSNLLLKRKEEEKEEEEAEKVEESISTSEGDDTTKTSQQRDDGNKEETAEPTSTSKTPTQQPLSGSFLAASGPLQSADNNSQKSKIGGLRVYRTTSTTKGRGKWHKVQYADQSWFLSHILKRSGTFTPVESDPPERVLRRVRFLMAQANYNHTKDSSPNDSDLLPHYHAIFANCECVAVWCKTGVWSTLQAASMLGHAAVGQAKATATLAGAAAASTVSVPAGGVWGWLGYTSSVPLMTANPFVLPALVAFGAVTVGGPTLTLMAAKRRWKATTEKLNKAMEEDTEARQVEATLVT